MIVTICSGGSVGQWAVPYFEQADYLIGADQGAHFLVEQGFTPHLALGDFDSVSSEQYERIEKMSSTFLGFDAIDKDYTDTQLAVMHALELKPERIIIVGALGSRFDHSLANIQLLELALERKIAMMIIDEHNVLQLMEQQLQITRNGYRYVSLLPHTEKVTGITLHGFKYPLTDATLTRGLSIGISNELLEEQGTIVIGSGKLLVIQAND
ncbi:thiamine pyrophosphokinase [Paenibacillus montaniterrae]|uniref:Thiamine diphosphokinase n=1 Tax=Paenibacillus montaniterrae TaxID=429341 RepID=A0A920CXC1_9BACL|nr:thiamine diphosphokinase [Paenibacillus montaniterrae]GIP14904.1 thiamine pyrophosphokinase [Paenibacillus montaniterrae]